MGISINKQGQNEAKIEGILSEVNLTEGTSKNNQEYIRGEVAIEVVQDINSVPTVSIIPVSVFANKKKKDGGDNPGFKAIKELGEKFNSIASAGLDKADKIRLNKGEIEENSFYANSGELITSLRIKNTFFTKVTGDFAPKAEFVIDVVIDSIKPEVDKEGVETNRLIVKGFAIQYGGRADLLTFYVENAAAKNYLEANYRKGNTVKLTGKFRFITTTEEKKVEQGFGEPLVEKFTRTKRELVITGGSAPFDEDEGYDAAEIAQARTARDNRLNEIKVKGAQAAGPKQGGLGF